jgi:hypothetical protein
MWITRATIVRVDASGSQDVINITRSDVSIDASYFHDPNRTASSHDDICQIFSGSLTWTNSTGIAYTGGTYNEWVTSGGSVGMPMNSCLQVGQLSGDITFITVDNCIFDGGNDTINGNFTSDGTHNLTGPCVVKNTRFGPDCRYGPVAGYNATTLKGFKGHPNVTWGPNNVHDVDGTAI